MAVSCNFLIFASWGMCYALLPASTTKIIVASEALCPSALYWLLGCEVAYDITDKATGPTDRTLMKDAQPVKGASPVVGRNYQHGREIQPSFVQNLYFVPAAHLSNASADPQNESRMSIAMA